MPMKIKKFSISNAQYDFSKKVITIIIPAGTAALTALGELYGFDTTLAVGTIAIVTTLAGTVLNALSNAYNEK